MRLTESYGLQKWISAHGLVVSFLSAIGIGIFLLKLPYATYNGISFLDACFTATSAVCVTGLIVVDTASAFTTFGKIVILFLIQIGGLGIMTFATSIVWALKQKVSLSEQLIIENSFLQGQNSFSLKYFLFFLIKFTFITEFIGACLYFFAFDEPDLSKRMLFSIFHSVSAFCNAGFSLYSDSLIHYGRHIPINLITMILIILGGIGFLVVYEITYKIIGYWQKTKRYRAPFLSLHSWTVLTTSLILIIGGAILMFSFQLLQGNSISLLHAFFQSITCRTAGFNTLDISMLSRSTLLIMIFLMFIGGSPGSTAGGIKTTTFAILIFILLFGTTNFDDITARGRTIPQDIIYHALLIFVLSFFWVFIGLIFLVIVQKQESFISLLFEIVSAFGTVGLSTGITSYLEYSSKIVIIATMFTGRLGSLSIFSLFLHKEQTKIRYAEENILIG
ncbi:MAG: TrkH family potassium uptake protein [bacterium]